MAKSIGQQVKDNLDLLQNAEAREVYEFAKQIGVESPIARANFRKALIASGLDPYPSELERLKDLNASLASSQYTLVLYCNALADSERFAICDVSGNPVWHGVNFDRPPEVMTTGEFIIDAIGKCVWLAEKVRYELKVDTITVSVRAPLEIFHQLTNGTESIKEMARGICDRAITIGVSLNGTVVSDKDNPATKYIAKGKGHVPPQVESLAKRLTQGTANTSPQLQTHKRKKFNIKLW